MQPARRAPSTFVYDKNYDLHTDGERLLMIEEIEPDTEVTLNWFDELKRLVLMANQRCPFSPAIASGKSPP